MLLTEWKFDVELEIVREEAMEKGMARGMATKALNIARNLKAEGMDTATVARVTNLTPDETLQL